MTQAMILVCSFVIMGVIYSLGRYMVLIFVDPGETDVIQAAQIYFQTVAWCYPFLEAFICTGMLFREWATAWFLCWAGSFELIARWGIVALVAGNAGFGAVCMSDPAAWIAALIPLIPYYFWIMRKERKKELSQGNSIVQKGAV